LKVIFSFQNNNDIKPQNSKINFGAGLTPKMMEEIRRTDVLEISKKLAKKGILTDFKGNKVVAWCCDKTVGILEELNNRFGQKLALPSAIEVENFERLNVENSNALGTCNMLPTKLKKNSNELTLPRAIFFNSLHNWENIDKIADNDYAIGLSSTPHFLNFSLHESVHSAHEDRLLDKVGATIFVRELDLYRNRGHITGYQKKYGGQISQICDYAKTNPFEAIACDIPRVIVSVLDKETLMPIKNPFTGTPYDNLSFWQRLNNTNPSGKTKSLNKILRRFWNGKFD